MINYRSKALFEFLTSQTDLMIFLFFKVIIRWCDSWKPSFLLRLIFKWRIFSRRVTARWSSGRAQNQVSTNQNLRNSWPLIARRTIRGSYIYISSIHQPKTTHYIKRKKVIINTVNTKRNSLVLISLLFKNTKFNFLKSILILKHQANKCWYFFWTRQGKVWFVKNLLDQESPTLTEIWKEAAL